MGLDSNELRAFSKYYTGSKGTTKSGVKVSGGGVIEFDLADSSKAFDIVMNRIVEIEKDFTVRRKNNILKRAAEPMRREMYNTTPVDTGELRETIAFKQFKGTPYLGVIRNKVVEIFGKGKEKIDKAFIAYFLEFGFTQIAWPERKKRVGDYNPSRYTWVEGKGWLKDAFDSKEKEFYDKSIEEADKVLQKVSKKHKVEYKPV